MYRDILSVREQPEQPPNLLGCQGDGSRMSEDMLKSRWALINAVDSGGLSHWLWLWETYLKQHESMDWFLRENLNRKP